jgi:hypothetical protein
MSEKLPPHREEYIVLADVTHDAALITWGAFFFRVKEKKGKLVLLDDEDLDDFNLSRSDSIGSTSATYGAAYVEVEGPDGTVRRIDAPAGQNHCWVEGLQPDTRYRYWVTVGDKTWAAGPLFDWDPRQQALVPGPRAYRNEFRTHPHPAAPLDDVTFAVIGDYGKGVKKLTETNTPSGQAQVAQDLEKSVDMLDARFILTTGDNIYAKRRFGIIVTASGDEDDDWFFTYYQPYRYVINRVPVYPSVGNHDSDTEAREDREALVDNAYMKERIRRLNTPIAGGSAQPPMAVLSQDALMYRIRYGRDVELVAIDSSAKGKPYTTHPEFIGPAFPPKEDGRGVRWRIPFFHHPPFCGGPLHGDDESVQEHLVPVFSRAGVKLVLTGHEHNYQRWSHSGVCYVITGAAGSLRTDPIKPRAKAGPADPVTEAWASEHHHLLVTLTPASARLRPIVAGGGTFTAGGTTKPDAEAIINA